MRDVYRDAPQTRHSITISGGGDVVQTMANLSYFHQEGTIWERTYERMNLRMNNNFNFSKSLSGHLNLFYQAATRKTQATGFPEYEAIQGLHIALRNETYLKQFNHEKGIVYKTVNGENLDLILFLPKIKKYAKTPVILYTHGGGWAKGDKFNILQKQFVETLQILIKNGIACATIEYRLTRPEISTAFDAVVDCKDAGRFLVKNADKYGLDAKKVGVWGGSAGGHLSLMTALGDPHRFPGDEKLKGYDPEYKCVAAYFPLTTFINPKVLEGSNFANPQRFIPMFGGLLEDKRDTAKLLSPAENLTKNSPPILLLHGDNDKTLPIENSLYMMKIAKEKKARVEMLTVKGAGHSFSGENIQPGISEINKISAEFIIKHLLN